MGTPRTAQSERLSAVRLPRFYLEAPLVPGERVRLSDAAFRHGIQVLRLSDGAPLVLFNGDGFDYHAVLDGVSRREAWARIEVQQTNLTESPLDLCLVQGIGKNEHMDLAVQKAVELGVHSIRPVICARSQHMAADRLQRRHAHWRGVIVSACEQSGRSRIPEIQSPVPLRGWLENSLGNECRIMLDPGANDSLATHAFNRDAPIEILVGPEGGLSEQEVAESSAAGVVPLRMGPRVLRTETAAIAAIAWIQLHCGDMG